MAEEEEGKKNCCWTVATNWIVAHGSLQNTVSFESPISPIEEEESDARSKAALVLKPAPSDSSPCEISVSFNQKHEIRQVYVRSAARIYEIYYALEQQSSNEYLCTVRCGVVAKEDEILPLGDSGEATSVDQNVSSEKTPEVPKQTAKSDIINSSSSDEDGWVEVKVPDSPLQTDTTDPMAKELNQSTAIKVQDYYEATAEIADTNPCISLTLRLLSLQVKGYVSIEEIYIFAEPVESIDVGHQSGPVESSAGSNLLAMLVPSLLQISKSGISRVQDRHVSDIREGQNLTGCGPKATESIVPEIGKRINQETPIKLADPGEVKTQEPAEDRTELRPLESGPQLPHSENISESVEKEKKLPVSHVEKMLGQLDSRVARIEAFCVRFEENMMTPLNYMATRLQRLEQKLDELTFRSQSHPKSFPCSRITAPEFSYDESESNSLHTHNNYENGDSNSESEKRDAPSDEPSSSNVDATASAISPELVPHLVVTAPEFSNDDDDDDGNNDNDNGSDDISEFVRMDLPLDKPSLSIDNALASALASLILSTSTQPLMLSSTLMIEAPDFANEEENDERASHSASVSFGGAKNHGINFHENDGTDNVKDLDSFPCTSSSQEGEVQLHNLKWPKESPAKATAEGALAKNQLLMGGIESCTDIAARNLNEMGQTDNVSTEESTDRVLSLYQSHREWFAGSNTDSNFSGTVEQNGSRTDTVEVTSANQFCADDISTEATVKGAIAQPYVEWKDDSSMHATIKGDNTQDGPATSTELWNAGFSEDKLENELKQATHPVLDFKLPILDVKFISQENLFLRLPLETLLGDVSETRMQGSGIKDNDADGIANGQQNDPDLGVDGEQTSLRVNDPFSELEDLTVKSMPSSFQGEELQDATASGSEEPFSSLI